MARPRKEIVSKEVIGIYHCISRCVRRAFLCGKDHYSGKSFTHRRVYIKNNLKDLATHYCLKVINSSVESNHLHVVVKLDPFASAHFKPEEVVRRWRRIFPHRRNKQGKPVELTDEELMKEIGNAALVAEWRSRLVDLGWFMRCLKEPIARMANKEDECKGHFWEKRFDSIRIEDDAALMACLAYVDLNSVRSGEVDRPEHCDFASIQDRIKAYKARRKLEMAKQYREVLESEEEAKKMMAWALRESKADQWLCPLEQLFDGWNGYEGGISEEHYLELVDWTGRKLRDKDAGHIPPHLASILDRMEVDIANWAEAVEHYGGLFHVFAGKARRLRALAKKMGQRCCWGVNLKVPLYRVGA